MIVSLKSTKTTSSGAGGGALAPGGPGSGATAPGCWAPLFAGTDSHPSASRGTPPPRGKVITGSSPSDDKGFGSSKATDTADGWWQTCVCDMSSSGRKILTVVSQFPRKTDMSCLRRRRRPGPHRWITARPWRLPFSGVRPRILQAVRLFGRLSARTARRSSQSASTRKRPNPATQSSVPPGGCHDGAVNMSIQRLSDVQPVA
jgi:hypothetical protein